jgi:cold shock protein
MNGKVKFYDTKKRFGFIAGEDGKEYFVHQTGLPEGMKLFEEDEVTFDVEDGERGPKAVNVTKGSASAESSEEEATEEAA